MNKLITLLILILLTNIAFAQTARSIRTDNINPNVVGGTIDIIAPITINGSSASVNTILDEDDMISDSSSAIATQQSIKAYVDGIATSVDGLGDVSTDVPVTTGEALVWDGSRWTNQEAPIALLNSIGDVSTDTAISGEALVYDGSNWTNQNITITQLNDIGDVSADSPTVGHVLTWDGSNWIPQAGGGAGGGISAWTTATAYSVDDVVHESNRIYLCLIGHTSGVFATDLASGNWVEISNQTDTSPEFNLDTSLASAPAHAAGKIWWDSTNDAMVVYNSESEVTQQIGQEVFAKVRNITGSTITNGSVVYINGVDSGLPTIVLANASAASTALGTIGIATHDIESTTDGFITTSGVVRDVNTSSWTAGDQLYLSTTDGQITNVAPGSPNYQVALGNAAIIDAATGTIQVHVNKGSNWNDIPKFWNGSTLEPAVVTITESAGTVYANVEKSGGGNFHIFFDNDFTLFDASSDGQVALTAGSDSSPTLNYVYIPQSTNVLTASTVGFPSTQHAPIATVLVQSAADVAAEGPYKVHAWTDHLANGNNMGHVAHINYWIRQQHATWVSGMLLTPTYTPQAGLDNIDVAVSAGNALQLHPHDTPTYDTSTGSTIHVVNDFATPYNEITDLNAITTTTDGTTLRANNSFYSIVVWQSVNETSGESKLFANAPSCKYASESGVQSDVNNCSVYTIPDNFKGTGVLLARLNIRYQTTAGGTLTATTNGLDDLRGQLPATSAGGGTSGSTTYPDNVFRIFDNADSTKNLAFEASNITTGNTRTLTIPDKSGNVGLFSLLNHTDTYIPFWNSANLLTESANFTYDSTNDLFSVGNSFFQTSDVSTDLTLQYVSGDSVAVYDSNGSLQSDSGLLWDATNDILTVAGNVGASQLTSTGQTAAEHFIGGNVKKNYITNSQFETDTTGWFAYQDASADTPTDGTGTAATGITFTRTNTALLRDSWYGSIANNGTPTQGEGVSYDFTVDRADASGDVGISFMYETSTNYVGTDSTSDIIVYLYDVTNSKLVDGVARYIPASNGVVTRFSDSFPLTGSTSYRLIFHSTDVDGANWTMSIDDVSIDPDPFVYKNLQEENVFTARIANSGTATITSQGGYNGAGQNAIASVNRSATGVIDITYTTGFFSETPVVVATPFRASSDAATATVQATSTTGCTIEVFYTDGANQDHPIEIAIYRQGDDYRRITEHVVTPAKLNGWQDYTPTTQGIGTPTGVNFQYVKYPGMVKVMGSLATGTVTATEFRLGLPENITAREITGASGRYALIGKIYRPATNTLTSIMFNVTTVEGADYVNVSVDWGGSGNPESAANGSTVFVSSASYRFEFMVPTDDVTDNTTFLAAVPVQKVAYLKDLKTSGTAGGSSSANTVQTRDLNTIEGDSEIVSLSANQFTLAAGKYKFNGSAPSYRAEYHQLFLYDVTNSSYVIDGSNARSEGTDATPTHSFVNGTLTITSATTYELRHWTNAAVATSGLGLAADVDASNPQSNEVYSVLEITKLR